MLRHTEECRQRGYPFIADPRQQLAFSDGELIRDLIDGAAILFSNEYESHMIEQKTGWSADEVLARVGIQVTTLGKDGVRVERQGRDPVHGAAAKDVTAVEPTGVGDAFRAGFLAALSWGLGLERAAQVGCVLAAYVVETVGTQEYTFTPGEFVARIEESYGAEAAAEVGRARPVAQEIRRTRYRGVPVRGGVLADVLLLAHPAPRRYVVARGRVVGDHRDHLADLDIGDPPGQLDHRHRAELTAAVQLEPGLIGVVIGRAPPGSRRPPRAARRRTRRPRRRSCRGSARPARCRG